MLHCLIYHVKNVSNINPWLPAYTESSIFSVRYSVYVHMPYSNNGPQVMRIALWTSNHGLKFTTKLGLFPEKYSEYVSELMYQVISVLYYYNLTNICNEVSRT